MLNRRMSGVLLHPTSLPGPHGIGELGPEAFKFADWLAAAGQTVWQMLPIGPPGYGESPYQLFSAFAGNPMLISLDTVVKRGWLRAGDIAAPGFAQDSVEFERVMPWKTELLREAFAGFRASAEEVDLVEFEEFSAANSAWLESYAAFMALKQAHGGAPWTEWSSGAQAAPGEIEYQKFLQWEFAREWAALREYCGIRRVRLMGDAPIYVAHDSADVWAHPDLFQLDSNGRPTVVAGVPPDYFSATGQLWGNPIYRWNRLADTGYRWWVDRMRAAVREFDIIRLDHFRGFEAYWEVPAGEKTAEKGRWAKGPGAELLDVLRRELRNLPFVAENLGVITPEVEAIRNQFGLPGMAILQFAFGDDPQAPTFRPHNYVRNLAAYTGTHDNDTVVGWWNGEGGASTRTAAQVSAEKERARAYLNNEGREINWTFIGTLMSSVANLVVFPAQDLLGLGSESRMNIPAVPSGNWRWRMAPRALTPEMAGRLKEMSRLYERGGPAKEDAAAAS